MVLRFLHVVQPLAFWVAKEDVSITNPSDSNVMFEVTCLSCSPGEESRNRPYHAGVGPQKVNVMSFAQPLL